jgi:membrane-associated protease RseP (regulator of RpoE activity)
MVMPPFPSRSPLTRAHRAKPAHSPRNHRILGWACGALGAVLIGCGPPQWPGGIVVHLGKSPRGVRVVEIPAGSPALAGGLQPNDMILAVDGHSVADLPDAKLHALLAGEVGSIVQLRVDRAGTIHELRVQRAPYRQGESTAHLRPPRSEPRSGT